MPEKMKTFCSYLLILALIQGVVSQTARHLPYRTDVHIVPHALDLDHVTFDKVLAHFNITVVLFLDFLTVGAKHIEYKKFAESTVTQPAVAAATVGVTNVAESNNWSLAERLGITMDDLPVVKIFVNGKEKATFTDEMTCDNLRKFVTDNTGLWVGRSGTLEKYDELAEKFIKASSDAERENLKSEAVRIRDEKLTEDDQIKSAMYYIRVMEQYMAQGPTFLGFESGRLKKMRAMHKFHYDHLCGITKEQNILQSFQSIKVHLPHDEL